MKLVATIENLLFLVGFCRLLIIKKASTATRMTEKMEKTIFFIIKSGNQFYFVKLLSNGRRFGKENKFSFHSAPTLVGEEGLEPSRYCYHKILSLARLPVPPLALAL